MLNVEVDALLIECSACFGPLSLAQKLSMDKATQCGLNDSQSLKFALSKLLSEDGSPTAECDEVPPLSRGQKLGFSVELYLQMALIASSVDPELSGWWNEAR